jgi:hypothetical protein
LSGVQMRFIRAYRNSRPGMDARNSRLVEGTVLRAGCPGGAGAGGAAVAFFGPAGDLRGVGSGVDAELRGLEMVGLVGLAVVESGGGSGAAGQEISAALGDVGEFGDGGVVLGLGERAVAGVTPGSSGDTGDKDVVCGSDGCHRVIVEPVFDRRQDRMGRLIMNLAE